MVAFDAISRCDLWASSDFSSTFRWDRIYGRDDIRSGSFAAIPCVLEVLFLLHGHKVFENPRVACSSVLFHFLLFLKVVLCYEWRSSLHSWLCVDEADARVSLSLSYSRFIDASLYSILIYAFGESSHIHSLYHYRVHLRN